MHHQIHHLTDYIKQFYRLFNTITSNVHNLVHIVKEVERFGPLHTLSSYPFENELYHIKRMLRSGHLPLQQVINRICEKEQVNMNVPLSTPSYPKLRKKNYSSKCNEVVIRNGLTLSNKYVDKWFLTKSKRIVAMSYAESTGICGCELIQFEPAFMSPLPSDRLNIYKTRDHAKFRGPKIFLFTDVLCKFFAIPNSSETFFVPLHHSYPK